MFIYEQRGGAARAVRAAGREAKHAFEFVRGCESCVRGERNDIVALKEIVPSEINVRCHFLTTSVPYFYIYKYLRFIITIVP